MANEVDVRVLMERAGWDMQHGGWPDFICWRRDDRGNKYIVCIEVKNEETGDFVREHQETMHGLLRELGIPVYVVGSAADLLKISGRPILLEQSNAAQKLATLERAYEELAIKKVDKSDEPYTLQEAARKLGVSKQTATRIFQTEPGTLHIHAPGARHRILRIPQPVFKSVFHRLTHPAKTYSSRRFCVPREKAPLEYPNKARRYTLEQRQEMSRIMREKCAAKKYRNYRRTE